MANVLVNANGENSFPAWPLKEKTGMNATTMMRMAKKMAEPTSFEAVITVLSFLSRVKARCLDMFSVITIPASTITPIEIAIPPKDMMFEGILR